MTSFLRYGFWTGILTGLWSLSSFTIVNWLNSTAFHDSIPATQIRSYSGLFSLIILGLGIYLGMKQARARNANLLTYGQAVKTGVLIACITALFVGLFSFLYCAVINPGYTEFMVRDVQHSLTVAGKTPQEIVRGMEAARKEFSSGAQVGEALLGQSVMGILLSLILGLFLRRKNE
jgi:hypothetical protein